jgi:hypothetical protein
MGNESVRPSSEELSVADLEEAWFSAQDRGDDSMCDYIEELIINKKDLGQSAPTK